MSLSLKRMFVLLLTPLLLGADVSRARFITASSNAVLYRFDNTRDYILPIMFSGGKGETLRLNVRLYNYKTNALVYNKNHTATLTAKPKPTVNVDLPLTSRVPATGLKINLAFYQNEELANECSTVIYPCLEKVNDVRNYKNENYITEGHCLKFSNYVFKTAEEFNFQDTNEFIAASSDNSLDFSNITFLYSDNFLCDQVTYRIKDYENIYPHLNKENDEIILNMSFAQNGSEISFALNEKMYVNTTTLDMSSTPIDGYVETNKLFIPVGKESLFESNETYLYLDGAGYCAEDFYIPFTFYYSKKLIGECYKSDYCIEGGIRE